MFQCLQRKPANRLGLNGPSEVKQHVWLQGFEWDKLMEKKLAAPFVASVWLVLEVNLLFLE